MAPAPGLMERAVELALAAVHEGTGGPFGAVVVRGDTIVGEGQNRVLETNDPTAHAEVNAIRAACSALEHFHLAGCELITSCEPCPLCLAASQWARIEHVWFSGSRADAADAGFDDEVFYAELALPPERRSLPSERCEPRLARAAFDAWAAKRDRTPY